MKEHWIEYNETDIPKGKYELIKVLQDYEGTIIELESETQNLIIKFGFADAVRICDEGRRIKTYNEVEEIQFYRKNFYGIPLYSVINSQFCKWLNDESAGFYTEFNHYAIITVNDIVDVISSSSPDIFIKNLNNKNLY